MPIKEIPKKCFYTKQGIYSKLLKDALKACLHEWKLLECTLHCCIGITILVAITKRVTCGIHKFPLSANIWREFSR